MGSIERILFLFPLAILFTSCEDVKLEFNKDPYEKYSSTIMIDWDECRGYYSVPGPLSYSGAKACDRNTVDSLYLNLSLDVEPEHVDTLQRYYINILARVSRADWVKGHTIMLQGNYLSSGNCCNFALHSVGIHRDNLDNNGHKFCTPYYYYSVDDISFIPLESLPYDTVIKDNVPLRFYIRARAKGLWDNSVHVIDGVVYQGFDFEKWKRSNFNFRDFATSFAPPAGGMIIRHED